MTLEMTGQPIPTGGAVLLDLTAGTGAPTAGPGLIITRTTWQGGTIISSGDTIAVSTDGSLMVMFDLGDAPGDTGPLDPTMQYSYLATDTIGGSSYVAPMPVVSSIVMQPDTMTEPLIRLLQGAFNSLVIPPQFRLPQITDVMPLNNFPAMPIIVVNLDLIQQSDSFKPPIGSDVLTPGQNNLWTKPGWARRVWRVTVNSNSSPERDYMRDALLAFFQSLLGSFFAAIGRDMKHSYQASSGANGASDNGSVPGIYWAEALLAVEGSYAPTLMFNYGTIATIQVNANLNSNTEMEVEVGAIR